jgi:hypothetical protein
VPPKLIIEVVGDTTGLDKSFRQAGQSAQRFTRNIEQAGRGVTAASVSFRGLGRSVAFASAAFLGGAGAVVAIKSTVSAASNLNEQLNKSQVVFKDSGAQVEEWSKGLVKNFGISQRAALEAAGTFGNMLVPMGFARDKAANMSESLVELAGDLSSFNNASPQETLEAIRAGLAGEAEPLRRFGVFLNDARLKQEAMNLGLYKGKGNLDASAKAAATYAIILKDTKDAQGDFARTNDGFANSQRVVAAALENIQAQLGQIILPTLARATTAFGDFLAALGQAEGLRAKLQVVWDAIRSGAAGLATALVDGVRNVDWDMLGGALLDGVKAARDFLVSQLGRVDWDAVAATAAGLLVKALNTIRTQIQRVDWEALGGALIDGAKVALQRFGDFLRRFDWKTLFTTILNLWVAELKALGSLLLGAGKTLGAALKDGFVSELRNFGTVVAQLVLAPINFVIRKINDLQIPAFDVKIKGVGFSTPAVNFPNIPELNVDFRNQPGVTGPAGNTADTNARTLAQSAQASAKAAAAAQQQVDKILRSGGTTTAAVTDFGLTPPGLSAADKAAARKKLAAAARDLLKKTADAVSGTIAAQSARFDKLGSNRTDFSLADVRKAFFAAEKVRQQAEQRAQFRGLGLTGAGEQFAPTAAALKAQANKLRDAIKGTVLDTEPNRNILANIRKTINEHFHGLTRDTKLRMQEFLDAIADPLKDADKKTGFKHLSPNKLARMLGFTGRDDIRQAAAVLSQVGYGGTVPRASGQFAAGRGGGTVYIVHNPSFHGVDDIGKFEAALAKRAQARPQVRRGAR